MNGCTQSENIYDTRRSVPKVTLRDIYLHEITSDLLVYGSALRTFASVEPLSRLKYLTDPHPCFRIRNTKFKKKKSNLDRRLFSLLVGKHNFVAG